MRRRLRRSGARHSSGQALVEWALSIGFLVLLIIGGVQLLFSLYQTRNARGAAEDAANLAAICGGDTVEFREQLPAILATYRLDEQMVTLTVDPPQGNYLEPLTIRLDYALVVRVYGLFEVPIPVQETRALSQKDWDWD